MKIRFKKLLDIAVCFFALFIVTSTTLTHKVNTLQPLVDTATLYVGAEGWGPSRADTVRAFDTASCAVIFNVYDTLITFNGEIWWDFAPRLATNVPNADDGTIIWHAKHITSDNVDPSDPTGSIWNDGSLCIGWVDVDYDGQLGVDDLIYMIDPDGHYRTWQVDNAIFGGGGFGAVSISKWTWVFHLRTTDPWGNPIAFVDEGGNIVGQFDVMDAEYSFERGLVQDQIGSPMWMFYKPLFGQMGSDPFDSNTVHPTAMDLAHLIDDAINVIGNDLLINLGMRFPEGAFKQILSLTWASIVDKYFSITIGCWDGDLYSDGDGDGWPDWWENVRRKSRSPYDAVNPIPRPPGVTFTNGYRYVGTGPYRVITFDAVNSIVELAKNNLYWGSWDPFPGGTNPRNHFDKIVIRYIADWGARKAAFIAGDIDICAVPRANMYELLDPVTQQPIYPGIVTIKNINPVLSMDAFHFTFTVNPVSSAIFSGRFPDGIPTDFFNNTHVRRAFAYAFNRRSWLEEAWLGEAFCRETPGIWGLVPDYYSKAPDPPWTYDYNLNEIKQELEQAMFTQDGETKSVWDWGGFHFKIYYTWADFWYEVYENMTATFNMINWLYDKNFTIDAVEVDWPTYLSLIEDMMMPAYVMSWQAEFAEADNFYRTYMHSYGYFAYFQNYTYWNGWGTRKDQLIDMALKTPDGPQRAAHYAELDNIYLQDCPSLPLAQPIGRRWQWYWVKGWYYNPLYPGDYYYSMYKENTCWFNVAGWLPGTYPKRVGGVPDNITDFKDAWYLLNHFNAKAPEPGKPPDPKWVGTYGFGGVDPFGDRVCNLRDITWTLFHFQHTNQP